MSSTPVIDAHGVDKYFGRFQALDKLDLTVRTGQVAGFLGPNGSGKSTTIRFLLCLLNADSRYLLLLGGDPWTEAVSLHRRLAYVPGDVSLWPNQTCEQAIDLLGLLRGGLDTRRKKAFMERFELDPTKKARTYSKGNRQKVALFAALSSNAELLILDEPTSGLDPLMEAVFTECVLEAKTAGRTVLLSSHILSEVEKLCDTVTIIRKGRTVDSGTLDDLRHLTRFTVHAEVDDDASTLADLEGVHNLSVDGRSVTFDVEHDHMNTVMSALTALGVHSLVSNPPSLEELFMRHYGDELAALNNNGGTT